MKAVVRNPLWVSPMDELFDRFFSEPSNRTSENTPFLPQTDVVEDETAYTLKLALPGFPKESFKVAVENRVLTISGERKFEHEAKKERYHQIETRYGRFARSFRLPENVSADSIEATYRDGVLHVRIPKVEPTKLITEISVN